LFKHVVNCEKPSKDCPAILLLDNHESHIQIPIIVNVTDRPLPVCVNEPRLGTLFQGTNTNS
ncbi:hypothetical protein HHI36_004418, partial [Cryptolaemus montrouzieri]